MVRERPVVCGRDDFESPQSPQSVYGENMAFASSSSIVLSMRGMPAYSSTWGTLYMNTFGPWVAMGTTGPSVGTNIC